VSEALELTPRDAWNHALLESAHPPGWQNPQPAARYDLVVLGGGTAGLVSAIVSVGLGARVALVEQALLGGDCLNTGCVPSKTLIRSARAAADARAATQLGVRAGAVEVDFVAVMERVRRVRAEIAPHDSAQRFAGLGVDVFLGHGRFTGPDALEVGGATLRFKRAVIATGGRPAPPPIPGLADAAAKLVVRNAFFFGRRRAADLIIPWCTYTDPEVAHVGLSAREAEARRIAIDTFQAPLAANDRARADGDGEGFLKVHVKKGSDRIAGATLVARHAGEGIAPIAMAMAGGIGLGRLVDLILPYPTQTELVKNVAGAYTRTRLTPFAARVLRALIRLAR